MKRFDGSIRPFYPTEINLGHDVRSSAVPQSLIEARDLGFKYFNNPVVYKLEQKVFDKEYLPKHIKIEYDYTIEYTKRNGGVVPINYYIEELHNKTIEDLTNNKIRYSKILEEKYKKNFKEIKDLYKKSNVARELIYKPKYEAITNMEPLMVVKNLIKDKLGNGKDNTKRNVILVKYIDAKKIMRNHTKDGVYTYSSVGIPGQVYGIDRAPYIHNLYITIDENNKIIAQDVRTDNLTVKIEDKELETRYNNYVLRIFDLFKIDRTQTYYPYVSPLDINNYVSSAEGQGRYEEITGEYVAPAYYFNLDGPGKIIQEYNRGDFIKNNPSPKIKVPISTNEFNTDEYKEEIKKTFKYGGEIFNGSYDKITIERPDKTKAEVSTFKPFKNDEEDPKELKSLKPIPEIPIIESLKNINTNFKELVEYFESKDQPSKDKIILQVFLNRPPTKTEIEYRKTTIRLGESAIDKDKRIHERSVDFYFTCLTKDCIKIKEKTDDKYIQQISNPETLERFLFITNITKTLTPAENNNNIEKYFLPNTINRIINAGSNEEVEFYFNVLTDIKKKYNSIYEKYKLDNPKIIPVVLEKLHTVPNKPKSRFGTKKKSMITLKQINKLIIDIKKC
jgi:hypothetical protein